MLNKTHSCSWPYDDGAPCYWYRLQYDVAACVCSFLRQMISKSVGADAHQVQVKLSNYDWSLLCQFTAMLSVARFSPRKDSAKRKACKPLNV